MYWFDCDYPQSTLAFIYKVGKSYPFTSWFTKRFLITNLNLLRLHRPEKFDRSDRLAIVFANFSCQHMPATFLMNFASQKGTTRTYPKNYALHIIQWPKNNSKGDIFIYQPSSPSSVLSYIVIIFFQGSSTKSRTCYFSSQEVELSSEPAHQPEEIYFLSSFCKL